MLTVSSFNIRCFGCDGQYDGEKGIEGRLSFLKTFFEKELVNSDIIILQEIMDTNLLSQILPPDFKFKTYTHEYDRHMNVVICYNKKYEFINSSTIDFTALDSKRSRPCLYTKLRLNNKNIHIIGVHLKSGIHHTDNRLKQIKAVKNFIKELPQGEPIVIGGDFNSHAKTATKKEKNDSEFMEELLLDQNLERVKNSNFTYYTQWERECLDHIWVSKENLSEESLWTYDIEKHSKGYDTLYSVKTYYSEISDHLPISAQIKI